MIKNKNYQSHWEAVLNYNKRSTTLIPCLRETSENIFIHSSNKLNKAEQAELSFSVFSPFPVIFHSDKWCTFQLIYTLASAHWHLSESLTF
jgi:hypothetical protein